MFKTIVAFANGDGGTVLFGVSHDGGIAGVNGDPPCNTAGSTI